MKYNYFRTVPQPFLEAPTLHCHLTPHNDRIYHSQHFPQPLIEISKNGGQL